jgi:hypothetical protein
MAYTPIPLFHDGTATSPSAYTAYPILAVAINGLRAATLAWYLPNAPAKAGLVYIEADNGCENTKSCAAAGKTSIAHHTGITKKRGIKQFKIIVLLH